MTKIRASNSVPMAIMACMTFAAGTASASFPFVVDFDGTFTPLGAPVDGVQSNVLVADLTVVDGPFSFASVVANGQTNLVTEIYTSIATLTDLAGDQIVLSVVSTEITDLGSPVQTAVGTWTVLSGNGQFQDWTGSGTWFGTNVFDPSSSVATSTGRFEGTLVPAPGAVAALGLGGLVATRRRRTASA